MPRPSASPALRVLRTLRTGSRMTLRRHKDFLALAGALQKIAGYRGLLAVRASPFPWLAAVDEQVLVLCPQGEPSLGVVLPALYQNQYPAPSHEDVACGVLFSDGALMSYQKEDHRLTLHLPDEGKIHLHAPLGFFITGNLVVEGHISASQTISDGTRSMDEDRQRFDGHTHTSPETGASTSTPVVSS